MAKGITTLALLCTVIASMLLPDFTMADGKTYDWIMLERGTGPSDTPSTRAAISFTGSTLKVHTNIMANAYKDKAGNPIVYSSGGTVTVAEDSNGRYNLSVAGGSVTGLYTLGVASYEAGAKQTTADSVEDSFSAPSNGVAKVYILDVTWGWYYSGSSGAEENWGKATLKFNRSTLAGTGTMFVDNGNASGRSTSSTWANITLPTNTYGAVCNLTPMNNRPTSTYFNAYVDGDTLRFQIATTDTALDGLRTSWTAVGYASDGTSSFSDRLEALEARAVVAGTNIVVSTVNGTSTVSTVASPSFTGVTAGTGTFYQVAATTGTFGNAGSNTTFDVDGTLRLNGGATVWEDLRVDGTTVRSGVVAPTLEGGFRGNSNMQALNFVHTQADEVQFNLQIPHACKFGSTIESHVHLCPWGASAAGSTNKVRFIMEWYESDVAGTFQTTTVTNIMEATWIGDGQWTHQYTESTVDTMTNTWFVSNIKKCRLWRDNTIATNYADRVTFLYFDAHYEVDSLGSRSEFSK